MSKTDVATSHTQNSTGISGALFIEHLTLLILYSLAQVHTLHSQLTVFQVFLQLSPKLLPPVLHRDEGTH